MTRLVVTFLVLFFGLMAFLLFLIIVFSAALLVFSKGAKRREEKLRSLMEPEETTG